MHCLFVGVFIGTNDMITANGRLGLHRCWYAEVVAAVVKPKDVNENKEEKMVFDVCIIKKRGRLHWLYLS